MKKYIVYGLLFTVGAATGFAVTKQVLKKMEHKNEQVIDLSEPVIYDYILNDELAVKEYLKNYKLETEEKDRVMHDLLSKAYQGLNEGIADSVEEDLNPVHSHETYPTEDDDPYGPGEDPNYDESYIHVGNEVNTSLKKLYSIYVDDGDDMYPEELPYVITEAEFENEHMEREKITLIWYAGDSVLADEISNRIITDIDDVITNDILYNYYDLGEDGDIVYVRNDRLSTDYMLIRQPKSYAEEILGETSGYSYDSADDIPTRTRKVKKVIE